jgi:hypothetical protein
MSLSERSAVVETAIVGTDPFAEPSVSWAAIFAGAVVAVAATIMLLALGAGIGLTSISPWSGSGASATGFAVGGAVWLIITQWLSAALGGYLTGRMRTRWTLIDSDEVLFRDTAHGLTAWAIATIVTVCIVASAGTSVVSGAARMVGAAVSPAIQGAAQGGARQAGESSANPVQMMVDTLFRPGQPSTSGSAADAKAEVTQILLSGIQSGEISQPDRTYIAQLAASRSGISQEEAEKRVNTLIEQAKAAADKAKAAADTARKSAASLAFFTFVSMLIGAFIACAAAALGGHLRDE